MAGQSYNQLGEIGNDGVLRDAKGNEIPVGLDDTAKAGLQELLDGPKVRHMPSEADVFKANGGVLTAEPYKPEDSQQSGHVEDVKAATKSSPSSSATKAK